MKSILAFAILAPLLATGCALGPAWAPPVGVIYTNVSGPFQATENGPGSKRGQAQATGILGIVATGDASIPAAARAAGISKIQSVSYNDYSILGIYRRYTCIVTGD